MQDQLELEDLVPMLLEEDAQGEAVGTLHRREAALEIDPTSFGEPLHDERGVGHRHAPDLNPRDLALRALLQVASAHLVGNARHAQRHRELERERSRGRKAKARGKRVDTDGVGTALHGLPPRINLLEVSYLSEVTLT